MVVSVEISGMLEEKLRRLVELGIYASVSEAVRDAIRKMLGEMDLLKISMDLYIKKGCSLLYACHFSGTSCQKFIDYLLVNGITPGLGTLEDPKLIDINREYVMDASSIYVVFNSMLASIIVDKLISVTKILVPEALLTFYHLNVANAIRKGIKVSQDFEILRVREVNVPNNIYLTKSEYSILNTIKNKSKVLVSDDFYVQRVAKKLGIEVIPSVSFLKYAYNNKMINEIEYKEVLISLRGLPYIYPHSLEI